MKRTRYIFPVLMSTRLLAQHEDTQVPGVGFGFSHSTFASVVTTIPDASQFITNQRTPDAGRTTPPMSQTTFGFSYGTFLWVKVNDRLNMRPGINAAFSNDHFDDHRQRNLYARAIDLTVTNHAIINLKPTNTHGMIKVARCMSYYLTGKQPYVLIGPKLHYKKFDRGFMRKGFESEGSMGLEVGYGINYTFHSMSVAPEIRYSVETSAQNVAGGQQKITHTLSLAINMF